MSTASPAKAQPRRRRIDQPLRMLPGARTIYSWREGANMGTTLTIGSRRDVMWHIKDAAKAKAQGTSGVPLILKSLPTDVREHRYCDRQRSRQPVGPLGTVDGPAAVCSLGGRWANLQLR
jgi:hypothetical protein